MAYNVEEYGKFIYSKRFAPVAGKLPRRPQATAVAEDVEELLPVVEERPRRPQTAFVAEEVKKRPPVVAERPRRPQAAAVTEDVEELSPVVEERPRRPQTAFAAEEVKKRPPVVAEQPRRPRAVIVAEDVEKRPPVVAGQPRRPQDVAFAKSAKKRKSKARARKVRFPIGAKLVLIIISILTVSLAGVTMLVSYFVSKDTRINAEENNLAINAKTAGDCESKIVSSLAATKTFSELIFGAAEDADIAGTARRFFNNYPEISAVYFPATEKVFTNRKFFESRDLEDSLVESYALAERECVEMAAGGTMVLKNASPVFQAPVLAIFNPVFENEEENSIVIFYSAESFSESFSSGSVSQSFFVNHDGEILVHPDLDIMMRAEDFSANAVFQKMAQGVVENAQSYFADNMTGGGTTNTSALIKRSTAAQAL